MANTPETYDSTSTGMDSESWKERSAVAMQDAKERGAAAVESTADFIRRHPGKALAFGLALGATSGALLVKAFSEESFTSRTQDKVQDKVGDLVEAGTAAWERIRAGVSDTACQVQDAVEQFVAKIR